MMRKKGLMYLPAVAGISLVYLALGVNLVGAEVVIAQETAPRMITAPSYEAVVEGDGCLTHLRIHGQEFLAPGVSISRGSYFYQGGVLKLPKIEQPEPHIIIAEGDQALIRYEFDEEKMVWTLLNKTDTGMVFFLVFDAKVEAMENEQGEMLRPVVQGNWRRTTWFRGKARLGIIGSNRQWGPWQVSHQVWEASLAPGEERQVELVPGETSVAERARINRLTKEIVQKDLTIRSPRDYHVFQRRSETEGRILVSGRTRLDADRVEARILGEPLKGKLSSKWRKLPFVKDSRSFSVEMPLDAGGWYRLEVRAMKNGAKVAEASVPRFGVGEVFVGAGQSNSTNCGEIKTQQKSGMVSSFSGQDWRLADDPQPGCADNTEGGSFWPAFGDAMYERYKVPIGVAATGFGGTSINQWQPEEDLFKWTMTRIYQLGPSGFRALLWHQGESDYQMASEEYYNKLKRVIIASKAAAGWEFPWVVAQASYHNPENTGFPAIREAQERIWYEGIALEGPDTDTLTGDYRDMEGKGIHFSPKGLKAHGRMWAEKVGSYLDKVLEE